MQVTETKSEGLSREYKVCLPAQDIEEKISDRLKQIASTAQLPGFRPGKVPVSLLRKRYGPSVMGEVLEQAVGDSSQQALAEKGVRPAMQPEIEITSFEDGKDLEYTISVEMLPEIKAVDFKKIKVERLIPKTDEKAVQSALDNLANAQKSSAPIKRKRKSKAGDIVVIDFVGSVDGEEFPGGKADDYELELGSGSFIPGFEDQLIGVDAESHVDVNVSFPDEYAAADLAGKDAVFAVDVKEIREATPAPIDGELAKKVGLDDLEKLKEAIVEEQSREFNGVARMLLKRLLMDQLADECDFELPQKLAETEFQAIWDQYQQNKNKGVDDSDDESDISEDEQKSEFREIADRRVRLGLMLSDIGRTNNIQISQDDITQAVMAEARQNPGKEQEVMDYFQNNAEAMQQLTAPIYEEKVVDFIIEMVEVTDKEATMEELMKAVESDSERESETTTKPKAKAKKASGAKTAAKKKAPAKKAADKEE